MTKPPKIKQAPGLEEATQRAIERINTENRAYFTANLRAAKERRERREKKATINSRLDYLEAAVKKLQEQINVQ